MKFREFVLFPLHFGCFNHYPTSFSGYFSFHWNSSLYIYYLATPCLVAVSSSVGSIPMHLTNSISYSSTVVQETYGSLNIALRSWRMMCTTLSRKPMRFKSSTSVSSGFHPAHEKWCILNWLVVYIGGFYRLEENLLKIKILIKASFEVYAGCM